MLAAALSLMSGTARADCGNHDPVPFPFTNETVTDTRPGDDPVGTCHGPNCSSYPAPADVPPTLRSKLAPTRDARIAAGDPRPSIAERYADDAAYVAAVRRAAEEQVAERLLLPPDAEALIARAGAGGLDRSR